MKRMVGTEAADAGSRSELEGSLKAAYQQHNGLGIINVGPYSVTRQEIAVGVALGALLFGVGAGIVIKDNNDTTFMQSISSQIQSKAPEAKGISVDNKSKFVSFVIERGAVMQFCTAGYSKNGPQLPIVAEPSCKEFVKKS